MKERNITPLGDLISMLPEEHRTSEKVWELKGWYDREMENIAYYEKQRENTKAVLLPFRKAGSQHIAEFWVNDMGKPVGNSFNFHGQNISQWLYAGCILFDERDGRISTHH